VTITDNEADEGGGLFVKLGAEATLTNTIVSGNRDENGDPNNISGAIDEVMSRYNLLGSNDGDFSGLPAEGNPLFNIHNDDPGLMSLGFYGGKTKTHMPESDSDAVDNGDPDFASPPVYDQRGRAFDRVFEDVRLDIGAVEYGLGDPDDLPTVIDIIISGSNSIHVDYSFSEAFAQDIHESVPVGGADTIEVVFSEWVEIVETDLWLLGGHTGITYTTDWDIVDFDFNEETFTALWRFDDLADGDMLANPFPADNLVIGLNTVSTGANIIDASGNLLDGEWEYPMSLADPSPTSFASAGNGVAGGQFLFTFVILPGDFDLDNDADGAGFLAWQLMFAPNATDKTFEDGDYDGDGNVDSADLALWQANYGLDLTSWSWAWGS